MRLEWSDEAPKEFDWGPVRETVLKLVMAPGSGQKTIGDVLQSPTGDNACSRRAMDIGRMKTAWDALVDTLSVRTDVYGKGGLWKSDDAVKAAVERVQTRAKEGREHGKKAKVTAFSFDLKDATKTDTRFGGYHCVWLIDGGREPNEGRWYFVVYDQDVTCKTEAKQKWRDLCGGQPDDVVNGWALHKLEAKALVDALVLGARDGRPGPLIRFLYVVK